MSIDLTRYSGKWYEIAKYQKIFEFDCASATVIYKYNSKTNTMKIRNICWVYNDKGRLIKHSHIDGIATPSSDDNTLSLKFDRIPISVDYHVVWTDYDNFSIVGSNKIFQNYLWVLSRRPTITKQEYNMLTKKLINYKFNLSKLIINDNSGY
jgi:apolipoprotein D and lipocalin family protein